MINATSRTISISTPKIELTKNVLQQDFRKYTYLYIIYIPQSASDAAYIGAQRAVAGVKNIQIYAKKAGCNHKKSHSAYLKRCNIILQKLA